MQQDVDRLLQAMYDEFQRPLYLLAVKYGVPGKDADDLVQEAMIAYYEHYPLDMRPDLKRAMLTVIIRNKSIDYYRKYHRERIILDGNEFIENQGMAHGYGQDLMDMIISEELYEDVKEAMSDLSKDLKVTARLHLIEGFSETEVAQKLGISGVACRTRISRARKFLRERLGAKYGF